MSEGIITVSYIAATILFILALSGLSHQETARKGNAYGMIGMAIAIIATVAAPSVTSYMEIAIAMFIGGIIGYMLAMKVEMTQMPELVAILHSLVGMAAVLIGYATFIDPNIHFSTPVEKTIHEIEIYVGVLIGTITFSGSVIAFGKLSGKIGSSPLTLPARHWLNLALLIAAIYFAYEFVHQAEIGGNPILPLVIMTVLALIFGIHMVMAIGGADMPVVVSMLNSYSGWAAAATGFMLGNDLLIVTGALVGSSGAILSYIMCRAMNRNFISVIAGGFGTGSGVSSVTNEQGEVIEIETEEVVSLFKEAKEIMIIPGYGMAVAQAQHVVNEIVKTLKSKKINIRFGIHPVAGRMPGHMNVLLAEAKVPYDIVFEMDEINEDFPNIDVTVVIGANDIVNPSALTDPNSPIAGMPVLQCWKGETTIVLKRGMAVGYAGVENPLFFMENTRMYFGDAKESLDAVLKQLN